MSSILYPFQYLDAAVEQVCKEARIGTTHKEAYKASTQTGIAKAKRAKKQRKKRM